MHGIRENRCLILSLAFKLWQSTYNCCSLLLQVNYKSDLNSTRGVGWTPPGSHKVELARRAAELGLAEGVTTDQAIANYQHMMMVSERGI